MGTCYSLPKSLFIHSFYNYAFLSSACAVLFTVGHTKIVLPGALPSNLDSHGKIRHTQEDVIHEVWTVLQKPENFYDISFADLENATKRLNFWVVA